MIVINPSIERPALELFTALYEWTKTGSCDMQEAMRIQDKASDLEHQKVERNNMNWFARWT